MLEINPAEAAIVLCAAASSILDGAPAIAAAIRLRVAADELWLVGARCERGRLLAAGEALLEGRGLAVDQSDGWTAVSAAGEGRNVVFDRLMIAPMPEGRPALVQGAITGVPGKVLCESGRTHVFVPAGVGHHLIDRLSAVTADLTVRVGPSAPLILENEGAGC